MADSFTSEYLKRRKERTAQSALSSMATRDYAQSQLASAARSVSTSQTAKIPAQPSSSPSISRHSAKSASTPSAQKADDIGRQPGVARAAGSPTMTSRSRGLVSGTTQPPPQPTASSNPRAQALSFTPGAYAHSDEAPKNGFQRLNLGVSGILQGITATPGVLYETGKQQAENARMYREDPEVQDLQKQLSQLSGQLDYIARYKYPTRREAEASAEYQDILGQMRDITDRMSVRRVNAPVNMDSEAMRRYFQAKSTQEKALEGLTGAPRWLGEQAISIGQNAAVLPLSLVSPALSLGAMGSISAADRMYELSAQGKSADEALTRGLVSGAIEAATEKIPLDNLMDLVRTGGKSALKNLLKQAGVEAGEESLSYVMNYIADKAARDPDAEFSLSELANSAAGGAFSGLVFGGLGTAINRMGSTQAAQEGTASPRTAPDVEAGTDTVNVPQRGTEVGENGFRAPSAIQDADLTSAFGENGAQAYRLGWRGDMDEADYYRAFAHAYNAGAAGRSLDSLKDRTLTDAQRGAAFESGRSDADAAARKAGFTTVYGKDSGLVWDDYTKSMDQKVAGQVNEVAKRLGVKVRFADQVGGGAANGKIENGVITIARDAKNPVRAVFGHEITHRIQELAPEEYRTFREVAMAGMEYLDQNVEAIRELYAKGDQELSNLEAMDEIAADYAGRLMEDGALLDRFIRTNQGKPTLLEKLRDVFRSLADRLTGKYKSQARQAERRLEQALKAAGHQAEAMLGQKNTAQEGGGVKYSLKTIDGRVMPVIDTKNDTRDYKTAENYLKTLVDIENPFSTILRDAQPVHLGKDLPGEYKSSEYTKSMRRALRTAKMQAATNLDEMLLLAENGEWRENVKDKHKVDAQNGWYRYDTEFAVPVLNAKKEIDHYTVYGGTLLIRNDADGKSYLYDLLDLTEKKKVISSTSSTAAERSEVFEPKPSGNSIPQPGGKSNPKFSLKGSDQLTREIDRRMKQVQDGTRSEAEVRQEIRGLVDEVYQGMVEQYGSMKPGEKPAREVRVPRRTADDRKVSQTVRTILEAKATPDTAVQNIEELTATGVFSYETYTDKAAIADAESTIRDKGYATALAEWSESVGKGEVSKANTATGWALYNAAANAGDLKSAMTVLTKMVGHQRNAAQAVQATRILKSMSPEGQLYGVQRSVGNLQEGLKKEYGKNAPDLKIDPNLAENLLKAKDQKARDEATKELFRDIGRQMPSRFVDKWNAWRYLAMLGNPRTHVRNIVGNAFFAPVVAAKSLTATSIEAAVSRVSHGKLERTKGAVGLGKADRALLSSAWADYANVQDSALSGGKYSDFANANRYIEDGRVIFRNKALEKARKSNTRALDAEDVWFSRPHYAYALAQYCKANHISAEQVATGKGMDKARAYAVQEAQKATYRDTNALSQAISDLGRYRGKGPVGKGISTVMEGVLPFRKTPANILARGLEYSPAGLLKGLTYDLYQVRKGNLSGAEAIDHISAGMTGTGLLAFGVYCAAQCLVRGAGGDDKDRKKFAELQGHQNYALELPDGTSITLDWLAPEVLPFFIGVNLWEMTQGEKEPLTLSAILRASANVTEPLLEMSCLQSLNDVFDAVGYASSGDLNGLTAALVTAATSYLTQGVPTVLGQFERTGQEERMTTYTEKNAFLTPDAQYTLGRISGRIPGWDYNQIPYIDAWGRTERTGGAAKRAVDNFVNPAYTSKAGSSPMEDELTRLYDATGEKNVFPARAGKYFTVNGERKDLTAEEYMTYATKKGQLSHTLVTELTGSKSYQSMTDEQKVKAISDAYDLANKLAKKAVAPEYKVDSWVEKAAEAEKKHRIPQHTYVSLYSRTSGMESLRYKDKDVDKDGKPDAIPGSRSLRIMMEVFNTPGLSDKQRQAMFQYLGVSKDFWHWNRTLVQERLKRMEKEAG